MGKKQTDSKAKRGRPALTPEERQDELINLAVDLAEQQLRDGTASTQVIVHYLKLGSTRGMLEEEMLANKTELVRAQTESLHSYQRLETLYADAIEAMRLYSGGDPEEDEDV